jgi:hypothetical protein
VAPSIQVSRSYIYIFLMFSIGAVSPKQIILLHFIVLILYGQPVRVAEWSKVCTVFARSEDGIVCSNPTQGMDVWCLCICVRFSVCVQVEALRRADHPPKESYRASKI